jgi:hypothetical protein
MSDRETETETAVEAIANFWRDRDNGAYTITEMLGARLPIDVMEDGARKFCAVQDTNAGITTIVEVVPHPVNLAKEAGTLFLYYHKDNPRMPASQAEKIVNTHIEVLDACFSNRDLLDFSKLPQCLKIASDYHDSKLSGPEKAPEALAPSPEYRETTVQEPTRKDTPGES